MVEKADVEAACAVLGDGGVVAFPTDTVYGVGARLADQRAVDRLFAIKGRPQAKAVAVLVADLAQAQQLGELGIEGEVLAEHFWPGALTLVVRRRAGIGADLGGDVGTIGLRCPADRGVREMCRRVGPLATSSANRSGEATPADGAGVRAALGEAVDLVIDGAGRGGVASSVVSLIDGVVVLREGPIGAARLRAALTADTYHSGRNRAGGRRTEGG